jgi:uncharacterized protein
MKPDFDTPELLRAVEEIEQGNYDTAFELLVPLAQAENPRAQCNLATLYHFGLGVTVSGEKAVDLYRKVAEQNIVEGHLSALACNNLAILLFTGLPGVEQDTEAGHRYLNRARALGFEM